MAHACLVRLRNSGVYPVYRWYITARQTTCAKINRQALHARLHPVLRKPLCMLPDEARELVTLAEEAGWCTA